ncbi:ATP-binding response regulator [Desulfosoma caldarium]|uniref:histidine kinase n=1 Tax=Desulfosoma caldarium TaxID=610254 RepID=A0A3N1VTY3_9BACT|nr:response regulator [Desulfosoma caldarium]ROR03237.1 PAS domain S-box-containing protein [Desulfosoma caldarium]
MRRILVVDDEESTRELLALSLQSDGYEVLCAEDGYSAMEICANHPPQIVLTDIKMPGMDGIELLRRIKHLNADIEVIMITGHGQMELAIQALQLEASDFINKPISDNALSVALRRAEQKIWMREKLREYTENLECMLKQATDEIRKRYDFEHNLIQTSMDGIIVNDRDGNIILFSEGASRIYGYSREEAVCGLKVTSLYPEGEARRVKKLIYSQEYGGPGYLVNYETTARTKDGRLVPILLSAALLYEDGEEVGTVGYFKDITEVKELQARLLEQTRLAAMGEAMAEVAHGVKNILYGMKLGAYMVEKALSQGDRGRLEKGWDMVRKNMDRIARLSLEMLDYARGKSRRREAIAINDVINDVYQELSKRAQEEGVRLELETVCDLPYLFGDVEAFHSCVLNLMTNALEAFGEESVEKRVTLRTFVQENRWICVEVEDTGRGIPPEVQDKIFHPLFTTKGARGTGLGLAIAQKIVQELGGVMDFHTTPGRGTTFRLRFPLVTSQ